MLEDDDWYKTQISLTDIKLSKYVGKCKIQYYNQSSDKWITLEKEYKGTSYSFTLGGKTRVVVRITDASGNSGQQWVGPAPQ